MLIHILKDKLYNYSCYIKFSLCLIPDRINKSKQEVNIYISYISFSLLLKFKDKLGNVTNTEVKLLLVSHLYYPNEGALQLLLATH